MLAVGLCLPVTYIFNAAAFLFSQGSATMAMIRLGSGKRDEAEGIMGNSIVSIILSGAVLTVVLYIFAEPIMYFFGTSDVSIGAAVTYMRIYTLGAVAIMGYMGFLQFVISQGATRQAMIYVVLGALLNIVLDPILIFGFDMGVAGAAIATVLSQLLIAVLSISFLMGKKQPHPQIQKNEDESEHISGYYNAWIFTIPYADNRGCTECCCQRFGAEIRW